MYLFTLLLCGMLEVGVYFLLYFVVESILIVIILGINKQRAINHSLTSFKSFGEVVLCRLCSTVAWCVIFSVTNSLLTPKKENGWEILDNWFPPDSYYFYHPTWHLIIVLAVCLVFTLGTFQIYITKMWRLLYYITISITTLIMFCILTGAGLPLYWH